MASIDTLVTAVPGEPTRDEGGTVPVEGRSFTCDACGESFEGTPGGAGLFIWTRGDEVRYEEPPLCEACAVSLSTTAVLGWASEEEE